MDMVKYTKADKDFEIVNVYVTAEGTWHFLCCWALLAHYLEKLLRLWDKFFKMGSDLIDPIDIGVA